jgi:hypothetical protein
MPTLHGFDTMPYTIAEYCRKRRERKGEFILDYKCVNVNTYNVS